MEGFRERENGERRGMRAFFCLLFPSLHHRTLNCHWSLQHEIAEHPSHPAFCVPHFSAPHLLYSSYFSHQPCGGPLQAQKLKSPLLKTKSSQMLCL